MHGKCAKVFIVPKQGITEAEAAPIVEKYIQNSISEYMRPVETVFVESLPKTKNGKLDYFHKG